MQLCLHDVQKYVCECTGTIRESTQLDEYSPGLQAPYYSSPSDTATGLK